jgi:hypothetical protein
VARIRSIHPALFTDEAFAGLSMAARVLLLGLWTEADDQGVFDWKPITLKMRIMPVDNVDVPALLAELEGADVIRQFFHEEKPLGAIRNFCKFQKPKTPKYRPIKSTEVRKYVASSYPISEATEAEPGQFPQKGEMTALMEEGGGKKEEETKKDPSSASRPSGSDDFENLKKVYPKRSGNYGWKAAERKFNSLVKTGVDPKIIIAAAVRLGESLRSKIGTEFIPMPAGWLNSEDFVESAVAAFDGPQPIDWNAVCDSYKRFGIWSKHAPGNAPGSASCMCPPEILARHGIEVSQASGGT